VAGSIVKEVRQRLLELPDVLSATAVHFVPA
jgi:hypothetical protein